MGTKNLLGRSQNSGENHNTIDSCHSRFYSAISIIASGCLEVQVGRDHNRGFLSCLACWWLLGGAVGTWVIYLSLIKGSENCIFSVPLGGKCWAVDWFRPISGSLPSWRLWIWLYIIFLLKFRLVWVAPSGWADWVSSLTSPCSYISPEGFTEAETGPLSPPKPDMLSHICTLMSRRLFVVLLPWKQMRLRFGVTTKFHRIWSCSCIFSFLGSYRERKELYLLGHVCAWLFISPKVVVLKGKATL